MKIKKITVQLDDGTVDHEFDHDVEAGYDLGTHVSDNFDFLLKSIGYRKQSKGEWVAKHHMSRSSRGRYTSYNTYTCNICGKANGRRKTAFCPHCGAKMGGSAE